ncbi:MAG: hypothetical protein ABI700_00690 [Chloroflexota bacterium]
MSKCENDLEQARRERDQWKQLAQQSNTQLNELRDILQSMYENNQARESGENGEITRLQNQRDDWRREFKKAEKAFNHVQADRNNLVGRYAAVESILSPDRFDVSQLWDAAPEQYGGFRWHSDHPFTRVGYVIVAENIEEGQTKLWTNTGGYAGSIAELEQHLDRVTATIWRLPDMADLRSPYIDTYLTLKNYKEARKLQLDAVRNMALFYHIEHRLGAKEGFFEENFDRFFNTQIKPHAKQGMLNKVSYEAEARRRIKQSFEATLKEMEYKREQIPAPIPQLEGGDEMT